MYLRESIGRHLEHIQTLNQSWPVLIQGETGVGKEVFAKALHHKLKIQGQFVSFHSAGLPETLFESELFGVKKGAFTDAKEDKSGLLETANGGTFFLDEFGDMPKNFQSKFLRVLDQKEFRRLGETRERKSSFFLICATNRDLRQMVKDGEFREDLYFRIKGRTFRLPPLRETRDEILPLLYDFLKSIQKQVTISPEVERYLLEYNWPGNLRELKNFALICPEKPILYLKDIRSIEDFFHEQAMPFDDEFRTIKENVNHYKRHLIVDFLNRGGNLSGLAEELGVKQRQVYNILNTLDIKLSKWTPE